MEDPAKPRVKLRSKIARMIVLNLLILLVFASAAELHLRWVDSYIVEQKKDKLSDDIFISSSPSLLFIYKTDKSRRLVPNAHVLIKNHPRSKLDVEVDTNSFGFRGKEISRRKKPGVTRIIVLGDSITLGDYLPEQDLYVTRMEHYLNEALAPRKFEVLNAGVGDIGIKEELDILEEQGLALNPDIVMVSFYLNDARPPWGFAKELGSYGFIRRHSLLAQVIYNKLVLHKLIQEKGEGRVDYSDAINKLDWKHNRKDFLELAKRADIDWGSAWEDSSWKLIGNQLDRLERLAGEKGFKVVVVCFPVSFQVYADFVEDRPQKIMEKQARDRGYYFLDLLPAMRKIADTDVFYDLCHPRPKANDYIGKTIADFMLNNVVTPQTNKSLERPDNKNGATATSH